MDFLEDDLSRVFLIFPSEARDLGKVLIFSEGLLFNFVSESKPPEASTSDFKDEARDTEVIVSAVGVSLLVSESSSVSVSIALSELLKSSAENLGDFEVDSVVDSVSDSAHDHPSHASAIEASSLNEFSSTSLKIGCCCNLFARGLFATSCK